MSARERWVDEHALQRQLRDLICLALVGDHVRWTVTDDGELADWLSEAAQQWRGWTEQMAGRLVASGIAPDGRVRSIAKDIRVNWVPSGWLSSEAARTLTIKRLTMVAEWARYRQSQTDGVDADLLGEVAAGLEAQLRADALSASASAKGPAAA